MYNIAIDGPAGAGKSTIAIATANLLYEYGRNNGIVYKMIFN